MSKKLKYCPTIHQCRNMASMKGYPIRSTITFKDYACESCTRKAAAEKSRKTVEEAGAGTAKVLL